MKYILNTSNQNKRRFYSEESVSLLTLQYILHLHTPVFHIWKVHGQNRCGVLPFHKRNLRMTQHNNANPK